MNTEKKRPEKSLVLVELQTVGHNPIKNESLHS